MIQRVRTPLQTEADLLDMELYRLLARVERLADEHKQHAYHGHWLLSSVNHLSSARLGIRRLMHNDDREATR